MSDIDKHISTCRSPLLTFVFVTDTLSSQPGKSVSEGSEDAKIHGQRDVLHVVTAAIH